MKYLLALLLLIPVLSHGQQKLKKKFLGTYAGVLSSYKIDTGKELIDVDSMQVEISLKSDGTVDYSLGQIKREGTYRIEFIGSSFVYITAKLKNQVKEEQLKLFVKDKHIEREGIYPQPVLKLTKVAS